jgi:LemA protein
MDMSALLGLVIFGMIVGGVLWLVATYNRLVAVKQRVAQAWSNIDVLLRQRHDELPKLVETCQQYMKYEQASFDRVLEARQAVLGARHSVDPAALGRAETELRGAVGRLFALAEGYPDLKASQSFGQLQQRISSLETGIADRRELYNDAVNENNVSIEQFPGSVVANIAAFRPARLLEFETTATADVDVKALFHT